MADIPVVGVWRRRQAGWGKVSEIRTWQDLSLEQRFNQPGPFTLRIPVGAQVFQLAKTDLLTFDFRDTRMTCTIEDFGASADEAGQPMLEVTGLDAMSWLGDALGWPSPTKAIDAQSEVRWYRTGPAETMLGDLIRTNLFTRLGYPIEVPASLGRGEEITISSSFTNVLEVVSEQATPAGIGLRVGLVSSTGTRATMRVEFFTPADRSRRVILAHRVGTLRTWKQSDKLPAATRAIVQAAKDLQSRDVALVNVTNNSITTTVGKRKKTSRSVSNVNTTSDNVTTGSPHDMSTGDRITFWGRNVPNPLRGDLDYFAIRVDNNSFKVADSHADALTSTAIDLTTSGSGNLMVGKVSYVGGNNKFRTGDIVAFTQGSPPEPLELAVPYHAIKVDEDSFKLALTRSDALDGVEIDLETEGSGNLTVTESTRRYRLVTAPDAETEWGRVREVLVDGNGDDKDRALDRSGLEALRSGAGQSGFEIETVEAAGMRYGTHYGLGDQVTVELLTGVSSVQPVGAVRVSASPDNGVTFQVVPGNPDAVNPMFGQAAIIRALRRQASKARED